MRSTDYYAAIDLGSNSFHMLVVRVVAGSIEVVSKTRRKVRLASGLTNNGGLSASARVRALDCLAIFAEQVKGIPAENITAVGTATLRKINSNDPFLAQIQQTLGHPLRVISGEEEAATIFQGIAHTTAHNGRLLAIDIGGASTELALGQDFQPQLLRSLDFGCVTWNTRFFPNQLISEQGCSDAIAEVTSITAEHAPLYREHGWDVVLGASGTFKALQEVAFARKMAGLITLPWLEELLEESLQFTNITELDIRGLLSSRQPTFISGLCILIGLFRALQIDSLEATEGALREGLIFALLEQRLQKPFTGMFKS
ncbi:hypothetical protein [Aliidiomarina sp.]|uniref:Ppx/GppA phosphatase family protein n=1 Tax=Aliidiomarina sp. TaxID=1872439 RepID=UPI003A4DB095